MADIPPSFPGYATVDSPVTDSAIAESSLPPLPPSPPASRERKSRRRAPSPPAPTIYLTGFRCQVGDSEYEYARQVTGDKQPYWFEEAYGAADFNEGAERRARRDMTLLENEVAIIYLGDDGMEIDRVTARYQRERARERALLGTEPASWPALDKDTSRLTREKDKLKEWRKKLEEKDRLKAEEKAEKQRKKDEKRASRTPMRERALNLLDFQKKTKQNEKPNAEVVEPQPETVASHLEVIEPQPEAAQENEKEHYSLPADDLPQLPSPPTHEPASIPLPSSLESLLQLPPTPSHDSSTTPSPPTTPTTTDIDAQDEITTLIPRPRSSSATQVQTEVQPPPTPGNSGLVRGVGTLERQNPENSGLVQDFGTLERARSLRAGSGGLFRCCSGRRK